MNCPGRKMLPTLRLGASGQRCLYLSRDTGATWWEPRPGREELASRGRARGAGGCWERPCLAHAESSTPVSTLLPHALHTPSPPPPPSHWPAWPGALCQRSPGAVLPFDRKRQKWLEKIRANKEITQSAVGRDSLAVHNSAWLERKGLSARLRSDTSQGSEAAARATRGSGATPFAGFWE